jgi:hypothetical protein
MIYTRNNKWYFIDREEAQQMLAFIDKGVDSCKMVAKAFMDLQLYILDSRETVSRWRQSFLENESFSKWFFIYEIEKPPRGWIGPPYLVTTRLKVGNKFFSIQNPIGLMGNIDLMGDFQSLKESLNNILSRA